MWIFSAEPGATGPDQLFDTDVDSLRTLTLPHQRSVDTLDAVYIGPAKDMLLDSRDVDAILKGLKKDLSRYENKYLHGVNKERALEKFGQLAEQVSVGQAASNMHLLLPYLPKGYGRFAGLSAERRPGADRRFIRVYDRFLQQNDEMLEQLPRILKPAKHSHSRTYLVFGGRCDGAHEAGGW